MQQSREFIHRYRLALAYGIAVISTLALLPALNAPIHGDTHLYQAIQQDFLAGQLPYRDRVVEYPPYAVPIFLIPRAFGEQSYPSSFMWLALAVDWFIKLLLLRQSFRHSGGLRSLLPLVGYSVAIPFLRSFLLQRYDLWPALISLVIVWLLCSRHYGLCGVCAAIGIGVKLYPLVFVPPLFIWAARQGNGRRFLAGLAGGLLPIALLGIFVPWWRFAEFQSARGLQCESLYASVLWLGHQLGMTDLTWVYVKAWFDVQGPSASIVLPWAHGLFAVAVVLSVALATCAAALQDKPSVAQVSRLLLMPLVGFVAFNQVLSPQYMIWILPLAALSALEGSPWVMLLTIEATIVTPIFYPSLYDDYGTGLCLLETIVLLARNLMLLLVWGLLVRDSLSVCRGTRWAGLLGVWKLITCLWKRAAL